jgi:CheY-like chemotaxis protein
MGQADLLGRPKFSVRDRTTILVVEDELFVRMMAVDALEDAGYTAIEAQDADQALILLEVRDDIDIVFTDVKMPGEIDGLGLATRVRQRWPEVAILITSGHLLREDAVLPPSVPFLQKPYRATTLLTELDRLLD